MVARGLLSYIYTLEPQYVYIAQQNADTEELCVQASASHIVSLRSESYSTLTESVRFSDNT
jgi:hypothetical protein